MSGAPAHLGAAEIERRLSVLEAADALEAALLEGFDPEADAPRSVVEVEGGQLLLMPAQAGGAIAVKLVSVAPANPGRGLPRVQGLVAVFDAATLAPRAVLDGAALTLLRTAAVSAVALRRLAAPGARRLVVFGRGPQARAHAEMVRAIRPVEQVELLGRDAADPDGAVAAADVVCCCTTARAPLFDGSAVAGHAAVVAIGSHEPDARETDDRLAARATVVVESRASALREAGDVVQARAAGALAGDRLLTLAELVRGAPVPEDRPRLFKSTGMSWEDAVVAAAVLSAR